MKKRNFLIIILLSFFIMPTVYGATGVVNSSNGINLRNKPSVTGSSVILSIVNNAQVDVIDTNAGTQNGCADNWFYVDYNGTKGYLCSTWVILTSNGEDNSNIEVPSSILNTIKALGFNDSYAHKLATLKTKYPNWNFVFFDTGLDWTYAINQEGSAVSRNLICNNNESLRSTDDAAYKGNGVWVTFDNNCYAASKQTIGYFMDPRNFLNETHIFMFEQLSYDKNKNYDQEITSILNGTFMSGTDNKSGMTYFAIFKEAAVTSGVNPVHLVSRVLVEQGRNGSTLSLGNGYNGNYVGYYNFFNIGATGNGAAQIITNGLAYAANPSRNWNTPKKSIIGGASTLSNSYINNGPNGTPGQDTIYFQKFDVVPPASFWHQYMQNVEAPRTESSITYQSYKTNNVLDIPYTFKIPYFRNMPSSTTLDSSANEDATLKSLSVTGCSLMPNFSPNALSYECSVVDSTANVTINAAATNSNSTITGAGKHNLTQTKTTFNIVVKAAAGNTKTYTINVNKVSYSQLTSDEVISLVGINNNSSVLSGSKINTTGANLVTLIKSTVPSAKVEVSNTKILATGNTITITNKNTKKYTVVIYGDNNGDGQIDILDLLRTQKHILGSAKQNGVYEKATDVNKDGKVDILDLLIIQKHILGNTKISQ